MTRFSFNLYLVKYMYYLPFFFKNFPDNFRAFLNILLHIECSSRALRFSYWYFFCSLIWAANELYELMIELRVLPHDCKKQTWSQNMKCSMNNGKWRYEEGNEPKENYNVCTYEETVNGKEMSQAHWFHFGSNKHLQGLSTISRIIVFV